MEQQIVHVVFHAGGISSVYKDIKDAEDRAAEIRAFNGGEDAWIKVSEKEWVNGDYYLQVESWIVR